MTAATWLAVTIGGFVLAVCACYLLVRVAPALGLVSRPGELNAEPSPVPLAGGPALLLASIPVLILSPWELRLALPLAFLVGLWDDVVAVPAFARAITWTSCGVLIALAHHLSTGAAAITAGVTLTTCAGINFLDGIDGIAGAVALGGCAGLLLVPSESHLLVACLAAGVSGCLLWNWAPARCYLGNSGSSLLGVWLSSCLIETQRGRVGATWPLVLCVAVPITESLATTVRRLRAGVRQILLRERGHGYDQLVAAGWPAWLVALAYGAIQLLASLLAALISIRWLSPAAGVGAACAILTGTVLYSRALRPAP